MYLDHEELHTTDNFIYLGSRVCKNGGADVDIKNRMNKARGAFFRLKPVWRSTIYSRRAKLRLPKLCPLHTTLWVRMLAYDKTRPQTPFYLPHKMPSKYHENILATKNLKQPTAKNKQTKQYEQHTCHKACPEKGGRQHLKDSTKMDT